MNEPSVLVTPNRFVILLRVSTQKQGADGLGVAAQRRDIQLFLEQQQNATIIKELVEKSNSIKGNGVKYLLVNGESVHSDAFQGDKAVISLQHYPTILCKVGNMGKEVKSLDEATKLAMETDPDEITNDGEQATADEEEEVDEDPLKMLF